MPFADPPDIWPEPTPTGGWRLTLVRMDVWVELLPPLARIIVTRRFRNDAAVPVEAVMSLPAAAEREILFGLDVGIGGISYRARALAADHVEHGNAIENSLIAIRREPGLCGSWLVSVAPLEPGAQVSVRTESIRPLEDLDKPATTLTIAMSAHSLAATAGSHEARLVVIAAQYRVAIEGQEHPVITGVPLGIKIDKPLVLRVKPVETGDLHRSATEPDTPHSWEAAYFAWRDDGYGLADPANLWPYTWGERDDRIMSVTSVKPRGEIRVIAPRPGMDVADVPDSARAMSAFAAMNTGRRTNNPENLCAAANVLPPDAHPVFIGPGGIRASALPPRKPALPEMLAPDIPLPPVPPDRTQLVPGGRASAYGWLPASLVVACLLAIVGMAGLLYGSAEIVSLLNTPIRVIFAVLAILLLLNAIRFFPASDAPVYRRLPILLVLVLPWLVALLGGPLGLIEASNDPAIQNQVLRIQFGAFVASALLPLALLKTMRGARRLTLTLGGLNLLVCFFVVAVGSILAQPGT